MKFDYCYRTKDNVEHWGKINAPNRDAAYAILKSKGIRPGKVVLAPGIFNLVFGAGKRWIVIIALSVALIVSLCYYVRQLELNEETLEHVALLNESSVVPEAVKASIDNYTRRQVIGDSAVIEKGIKTGWKDVFESEGDQFLASFAIPGVPAGVRSTSEENLKKALENTLLPDDADSLEIRQIKMIVIGMKSELKEFLEEGGTYVEYGSRLVQRQEEELGYYNRACNEIKALVASGAAPSEVIAVWEKRNNQLRRMGIRLVPMPD